MNKITALFSCASPRRFSEARSHKEHLSDKQHAQRSSSTISSKPSDTNGRNNVLLETSANLNESITWYPAMEFLEKEDTTSSYSFLVSEIVVDSMKTDGEEFSRIVERLTQQLGSHIEKANSLIASNEKIPIFSEDVEEHIRVAIGRTQLLLNKRMKQFREQLDRHLNPIPGQKITKLNDLHGLWALVDMQLEDIRACFSRIEKFRLNSWIDSDSANNL